MIHAMPTVPDLLAHALAAERRTPSEKGGENVHGRTYVWGARIYACVCVCVCACCSVHVYRGEGPTTYAQTHTTKTHAHTERERLFMCTGGGANDTRATHTHTHTHKPTQRDGLNLTLYIPPFVRECLVGRLHGLTQRLVVREELARDVEIRHSAAEDEVCVDVRVCARAWLRRMRCVWMCECVRAPACVRVCVYVCVRACVCGACMCFPGKGRGIGRFVGLSQRGGNSAI